MHERMRAEHLRYRRVMDWDIAPNPFNEFVTINGTSISPGVTFASNDGFASANPLAGPSDRGATGDFSDYGPMDQGALFDFDLGVVAPAEVRHFTTFYGAAGDENDALMALASVGVDVYSLGQPSEDDGGGGGGGGFAPDTSSMAIAHAHGTLSMEALGPEDGEPNTFIFAFDGINEDSDGDALPDAWEENGLTVDPDDGGPLPAQFIDLPEMGAHPQVPDIFVQIDWMSTKLEPEAIERVVEAFAAQDIMLHIDHGPQSMNNTISSGPVAWGALSRAEQVANTFILGDNIENDPQLAYDDDYDWDPFRYQYKYASGGFKETGRIPVFHYAIAANLAPTPGVAGVARDIHSSDFIIFMGALDQYYGNDQEQLIKHQAYTLMHELGHNLGLRHGGGEEINYKPNYLSIMNYAFETDGGIPSPTLFDPSRVLLDYSSQQLPDLDEQSLDETAGLGAESAGYRTYRYCGNLFGIPGQTVWPVVESPTEPIDWNCDGDSTDVGTTANINGARGGIGDEACVSASTGGILNTTPVPDDIDLAGLHKVIADGPDRQCDSPISGPGNNDRYERPLNSEQPRLLHGYDDWSNLRFDGGTIGQAVIQSDYLPATTPMELPFPFTELQNTQPITFTAVADTRVKQANPTTNYGTSSSLDADGSSGDNVESYLRFTVSGLSGTVQHATLRVYATGDTSNGPAAYATSGVWTEAGVTWNTRPTLGGGALENKGAIGSNAWVEYDVTALITGTGTYNFALIADDDDGVTFSSREGSNPPQLIVTPGMRPSSYTIPVESDARVRQVNPTTNYGTSSSLDVDGSSGEIVQSFLRFTVSHMSGTIQHATLRLYSTNNTVNGPAVYTTSGSWTEMGVTWNTRPAPIGSALDNKGAINTGVWVEYDVTTLVTGNGTYNFALIADDGDGVTFSSREGNNPPQLVVSLAP